MLPRTVVLLLTLLPPALSITTIKAFLAPSDAAASVLAVESSITTYSIVCTHACAANAENNQATLVNGPSTAGLTQIFDNAQRTIIYDCKLSNGKGDCAKKAISSGETRTVRETANLKQEQVVITAGVEKLGYVVATTTAEVNVTFVATTVTSGTSTTTLGVESTTSDDSGSSSTARRTGTTTNSRATAAVTQSSSSAWAAPTLGVERVGGAIVGLAGLLMAAL